MPEISFLLPVFNGERYLAETLRSLLDQDYHDYDIVIVNDGSTDRSREIMDRFQSERIKVLEKPNGGLVEALNFGLTRLDCQFVARIDADDVCYPHRLKAQMAFMEFTSADAVSARSLHIDEVGNILGVSGSYGIFNADAEAVPAMEPYLPHPFMFARRAVFDEIGGYRHAHLAEDADISWRLSERYQIAVHGEVMGKYRLHTDSISAKSVRNGRVQALFSQIAALNSRRREVERKEVAYDPSLGRALAAGDDWDRLFGFHEQALDPLERKHVRLASHLKLLDLARFRAYALEQDDIDRARVALSEYPELADAAHEGAKELIAEAQTWLDPDPDPEPGFWRKIWPGKT